MPEMLNPASRAEASEIDGAAAPDGIGGDGRADIDDSVVVEVCEGERPLLERACAEAFASSVNPKSAIAAEICGASLVPVMVTWTVSVSVSLLLSVMVTV